MAIIDVPRVLQSSPEKAPVLGTPETGYFDRVNCRNIGKKIADLVPLNSIGDYRSTRQWHEAQMIGAIGLNQLVERHPGMGNKERHEFSGILEYLAFGMSRLAKVDPNVTPMTNLTDEGFTALVDDVIDRYLPVVRSRERVAAEEAQGAYLKYLEDQATT